MTQVRNGCVGESLEQLLRTKRPISLDLETELHELAVVVLEVLLDLLLDVAVEKELCPPNQLFSHSNRYP